MNIKDFQQEVDRVAAFKCISSPYYSAMSSLGYLAQTVLERQEGSISSSKEQSDNKVNIRRLLVDVVDICSLNGWDLEEIVQEAISEFEEWHREKEAIHGTHTEGVDVRSVQAQD